MIEILIATGKDCTEESLETVDAISNLSWQTVEESLTPILALQEHEYVKGFRVSERKLIVVIGKKKIL